MNKQIAYGTQAENIAEALGIHAYFGNALADAMNKYIRLHPGLPCLSFMFYNQATDQTSLIVLADGQIQALLLNVAYIAHYEGVYTILSSDLDAGYVNASDWLRDNERLDALHESRV